jgi:hypothetical protein
MDIDLSGFTGSEKFYKHMMGVVLSEGAFYVAEKCQAHWLMDVVTSYQTEARFRKEEFQVWKLTAPGDTDKMRPATVTCDDGNGNVIAKQEIHATDFPLEEVTLWYQNKTIFLPSEY